MLTAAQNQILAAYVAADPVLSLLPHNADNAFVVADALNEIASPAYIVWRTSVSQDEIMQNGFDWTRVNNLSVGSARCWEWLFDNLDNAINPSKANVRAGIDEVWKGTAPDLAVRTAVYAHCKRPATIAEKLLAAGSGTDASPSVMGYDGALTYREIMTAMGW